MIIIITNDDLVLRDALRGVDLYNYMDSFSFVFFLRNLLLDTHSEALERFKCKLQNEIGIDATEYVKRVKQPGKYFLVPCSNLLSLCHATSLISSLCIFPIESLTYSQPPEIIDFLLKIE